MPPQLVRPSGQTIALQVVGPGPTVQQPPIWQEGESGGQVTKHAPQLVGSPVVSTQASPQHVCPGPQPVVRQLVPPMHTEPTHICPEAQASPQPPQFRASLVTLVSQPFAVTPSQFAKLGSQEPTRQSPPPQATVAWGKAGQTRPQLPQLSTSRVVFAQLTPQQVRPTPQPMGPHAPAQMPPEQVSSLAQVFPQPPQLRASLARLASQPSATVPLQSAKPALHEATSQLPARQADVACGTAPQVFPQLPQFEGSLVVFAHPAPQQVSPAAQPSGPHTPAQTPPEQVSPAAQVIPQPPQLVADDATLVSQPFEAFPSQSAKPPSQRATPQRALVQPAVAWSKGPQLIRQPPQLFTSPWVSAQKASQQVSVPVQPPTASHGRRQVKSRQLSPGAQSPAERHSTQEFASTRQRGVGELQSVSSLQPGTQVCVRPSQSSPMGQLSGEVLHSTQRPLATSQTGVAGVGAQSTLLVQAELPSGGGTKPSRMLPSSGPAST